MGESSVFLIVKIQLSYALNNLLYSWSQACIVPLLTRSLSPFLFFGWEGGVVFFVGILNQLLYVL
jgi:hypothetical protein